MILNQEEQPSLEDCLAHFGVKGMRWGVRSSDHPDASRKTNKEANKDAKEFARAKMFFGEGAGTRRKLIKAKVETKSKKDPTYKKAFDHHLSRQDMGHHAEKARSERRRKNVVQKTGKTARGVNRSINGPFAASLTVTAIAAASQTSVGKKVVQDILRKVG